MIYYVSAAVKYEGDGSNDHPFRKISQAANIAEAGDEIVVLPGIYREWVNPLQGGTEGNPIIYRALENGTATITGAERIREWEHVEDSVWMTRIPNSLFGTYNPYTTLLQGDWLYSFGYHTGEVYINGKSMYEAKSLEEVKEGKVFEYSAEPKFSIYKWYTCQNEDHTIIYANFQAQDPNENVVEINVRRNCFYPEKKGINYITVRGFIIKQAATTWAPPTAYQEGMIGPHWSKGWIIEDCEISDSKCNGISLGKYLQPENNNKWSLKRLKNGTQTQRDAVCQAVNEGFSKDTVGSHIVRRCNIHDCEQTGIVGHMGCAFSTIEECHIHHINQKHQLLGAEIGGIKFHAPIDTTIRACHIHHCTRGIWLDWQAQGTRVTQNLLHDNTPAEGVKIEQGVSLGEDLFIEVSHGPTLIDNNILLSKISCRIATQGIAFVHNIIGGPFTSIGTGTNNGPETGPRYTPYHVPHSTKIAGFMTFLHGDARFYNNVFIQQDIPEYYKEFAASKKLHHMNFVTGTNPYESYETAEEYFGQFFASDDKGWTENRSKYYGKLPVYYGGNVYVNGAQGCTKEQILADITAPDLVLEYVEQNGESCLRTNLYEKMVGLKCELISTGSLGEAFEPEQLFENPDGTPILFDRDYLGQQRGIHSVPGAIETLTKEGVQLIPVLFPESRL